MKRILLASFSIITLATISTIGVCAQNSTNTQTMDSKSQNSNMQHPNMKTSMPDMKLLAPEKIKVLNTTMWTCTTNASSAPSGSPQAQADEDMQQNPRPAVNATVFALQNCRDCTKITCYLSKNQMNTNNQTNMNSNNQPGTAPTNTQTNY